VNDHHHQPTILHHDQFGYVARCPRCNDFQIGFGNFYIKQSFLDFKGFSEIVHGYYTKHLGKKEYLRRDIHISSPYPGFGLLLSVADLERLNHILQKTLLIVSADNEARLQ